MSNNITLFSAGNVPAFVRNQPLSETTLALAGGAGGIKRISIKGGVFRLMSGGKEITSIEDRHLDVIIVKAAPKVSRVFYAKKWDPNAEPGAPDCWSNDGETPDPSIKKPYHSACHNCPNNVAGSGEGNSRACRFQQRLAVLVADDLDAGVHQLTLPATSLFGKEEGDNRPLQAYARFLAAQTQPVDVGSVVTRMKFDMRAENPKLFFKAVRWLTEDEYSEAQEAADGADANAAIKMTVFAADGGKNGTSVSSPAADDVELQGTRPTARKPVVQEEEEAVQEEAPKRGRGRPRKVQTEEQEETVAVVEADEPEVRRPTQRAEAVPQKKSKLADIVGEWDDE